MSSNCKHPTCFDSEVCRRSAPVKKTYQLSRSPIIRKPAKKLNQVKPKKQKVVSKDQQHEWFLERAKECTGVCCCCEGPSAITSGRFWKWSIAHVFPKEEKHGFPSIATHPDNFIELCIECHTLYDRSLHVAHTLPCWKFAVEKFHKFKNDIQENGRKFLGLFIQYSMEEDVKQE